jgi:hypothetical protein
LSAVSPWSNINPSAIAWLIVTEIIACALGGYLTGRLRTKWVAVHTDEVFFRDTANGFLAWAVALVMSAAFLASTATFMAGSRGLEQDGPGNYYADRLFQSPMEPAQLSVANRILTQANPAREDQAYLTRLVAARTGLSPADAEQRVSQVLQDARQSEETARRAASRLLLWIFVTLLTGAFTASFAATIGGRQRDHVKAL